MFRALILDMDGTIIDSERLALASWQNALQEQGFELSRLDFLSMILGTNLEPSSRLLTSHFGSGLDIGHARSQKNKLVSLAIKSGQLAVKPGAPELLAWASNLGIPIGIATSATRVQVIERLEGVGINLAIFHSMVSADEVKHCKPNPEIYLKTCAKIRIPVPQCLAVEDSCIGAASAAAAGLPFVLIEDLDTPNAHLKAASTLICSSLGQLSLWLEDKFA